MGRRMREEDAKMKKENALNNAQRSIWVTFSKEGVHCYPAALTAVSYTHLTLPTIYSV